MRGAHSNEIRFVMSHLPALPWLDGDSSVTVHNQRSILACRDARTRRFDQRYGPAHKRRRKTGAVEGAVSARIVQIARRVEFFRRGIDVSADRHQVWLYGTIHVRPHGGKLRQAVG